MKLIDVVIVIAVLAVLIVGLMMGVKTNSYPAQPFGGGGGGGIPATQSTILLTPGGRMRTPAMVIPGWMNWIGGWLVDKATSWIWDCTMGPTGQCTMANGPTGGGGGGGIPPQCSSGDFCSGGPMGPAAKKSLWNWFTFSEQTK